MLRVCLLVSVVFTIEGKMDVGVTETYPVINGTLSPLSTKSPADPTMIFFSMDYGMAWKITMLVLSSLALVLGTVILILNVYSNRKYQPPNRNRKISALRTDVNSTLEAKIWMKGGEDPRKEQRQH
ncbi:hypothetical protein F2P81_013806 [Scophthalmus maximus]|uniref:Uncharacterized protein n=1 Tax=Scophthalmus maximus TaxID=52904 RepID=A0A6A4SP90_SCOMX|nr:hypothetical protein F2P81_013806 [Scophthalmus maximus]